MKTFTGISISRGYAQGPIHVFRPEAFEPPPRRTVPPGEVRAQQRVLRGALQHARSDLELLQERLAENLEDASASHIFHAHLHLLSDPMWVDAIESKIRDERLGACAAVQDATEAFAAKFEGMENVYLAQKAIDLRDVARRVMAHLAPELSQPLAHLREPSIIVAKAMMPSDMVHLDRENTLAIVTEEGGVADHVSVVTRSLGIPGVTGVRGLTARAAPGDWAIVDGQKGKVLVAVTAPIQRRYRDLIDKQEDDRRALASLRDSPAITVDGHRVALWANVGDETDAHRTRESGAEAIGLFRTELAFLRHTRYPTEAQQLAVYRSMARAAGDLPLTIRTLDLGGDKSLPYDTDPVPEHNPLLGRRGIRRSLSQPRIFRRQLRALLRLGDERPIRILLPMVVSVSDVVRVREQIAIASEELHRGRQPHRADLPVGVMVETPAAVMIIEDLLPHCDFVSVGTNDLIQYMLVTDRTDSRSREHYTLFHPAVLRSLNTISRACEEDGKPLCLCGELAGFAGMTPLLLGLGYNTLSMSPSEIPLVKREVRKMRIAEARRLAADTLTMSLRGAIETTVMSNSK